FRNVRIKVVFAIELRDARHAAVEQEACENGQPQRLFVRHRQHARQTETHRTNIRVWRRAEFIRAAAPHLRLRFELNVRFQSDNRFVVDNRRQDLTTDEYRCTRIFDWAYSSRSRLFAQQGSPALWQVENRVASGYHPKQIRLGSEKPPHNAYRT